MRAILESPYIKFEVSSDGFYSILDKLTKVTWHSNPYVKRLGSVTFRKNDRPLCISLDKFELSKGDNSIRVKYKSDSDNELTVNVKLLDDQKTLELSYESAEGLNVENMRLIDESFWVTDVEKGYVVVPVREGLMIPSDSGLAFIHRFGTFKYEGCDIEMLGIVKNDSAILITWHDPYVTAEVKSTLNTGPAKQILSTSLDLTKTAKTVRVQFLGEGDYVTIAKAYRKVVEEKGWLVTWKEKIKKVPEAIKLFGASNFKLWGCYTREVDYKMNEKFAAVNWTFDEAKRIAEHLKNDLGVDRAIFIISGWTSCGYDNKSPDILPANPKCGGNEALSETSRRIQELGYLFCLHDNYQDIFKNSPSWSEEYVMKNCEGKLVKGGFWGGGQAYLICSKKALELAQRPQNLPGVKALFNPNSYFLDTTTSAELYECFDPRHPLTKWNDIKYKQALLDYAIFLFGVCGSECGKEWGIPHCHFFEGLGGVSGNYYHNLVPWSLGARAIPLFEMIYRDCVAVYGKYNYDYSHAAEYVLHHIIIGRPLHYHSWGQGLYWKKTPKDEPQGRPYDASCFIRADNGWAEGLCMIDRFIKNTHEILSPLHEITAETTITKHEFLTPDFRVEHVVFGEDVDVVVNKPAGKLLFPYTNWWWHEYKDHVHTSKMGRKVILPTFGFVIESPTFIAFHALSWNGLKYDKPVLFTIRSLDGKPISESKKIRVFHGFGEQKLKLKGQIYVVAKEEILEF